MNRLNRFASSAAFAIGLTGCAAPTARTQTPSSVRCGPESWRTIEIESGTRYRKIYRNVLGERDVRLVTRSEARIDNGTHLPPFEVMVKDDQEGDFVFVSSPETGGSHKYWGQYDLHVMSSPRKEGGFYALVTPQACPTQ